MIAVYLRVSSDSYKHGCSTVESAESEDAKLAIWVTASVKPFLIMDPSSSIRDLPQHFWQTTAKSALKLLP